MAGAQGSFKWITVIVILGLLYFAFRDSSIPQADSDGDPSHEAQGHLVETRRTRSPGGEDLRLPAAVDRSGRKPLNSVTNAVESNEISPVDSPNGPERSNNTAGDNPDQNRPPEPPEEYEEQRDPASDASEVTPEGAAAEGSDGLSPEGDATNPQNSNEAQEILPPEAT